MTDSTKVSPVTCPKGHEVRPGFTAAGWKAMLDEYTPIYFCVSCGVDRKLTAEQKANIRRWLEEN